MPLVAHRTHVNAPVDLLWGLMLEKVEHPERFVPGVVSSEILDRPEPNVVRRTMRLETPAAAKTVRELISWSEATRTTLFKLEDDPVYRGFVTNTIFDAEDGCVLDYTMHWTPIEGRRAEGPEPDWQATIRAAVLHAKELAEAAARGAGDA